MKFSFLLKIPIFICLLPITLQGNTTPNEYLEKEVSVIDIKDVDWEKATKELNYDPNSDELAEIREKERRERERAESAENNELSYSGINEILATLLKVFLVLGLVAIVLFLLKHLVGSQGVTKTSNRTFDPNATIDTQKVAEQIHDFDLKTLVNQATARKEYNVATRLYYLLIIKTLSEQEIIKWKKDKTNRSYMNEIQSIGLKEQFRKLTNIFERAWYGEAIIDETAFGQIEQQFQQFINTMELSINNQN